MIGGLAAGASVLVAGILKESVGVVALMGAAAVAAGVAALSLAITANRQYARDLERIGLLRASQT
jgi:hypothetical protein